MKVIHTHQAPADTAVTFRVTDAAGADIQPAEFAVQRPGGEYDCFVSDTTTGQYTLWVYVGGNLAEELTITA